MSTPESFQSQTVKFIHLLTGDFITLENDHSRTLSEKSTLEEDNRKQEQVKDAILRVLNGEPVIQLRRLDQWQYAVSDNAWIANHPDVKLASEMMAKIRGQVADMERAIQSGIEQIDTAKKDHADLLKDYENQDRELMERARRNVVLIEKLRRAQKRIHKLTR